VTTYKVVRYYAPNQKRSTRTMRTGLTLKEARVRCQDPKTHKDDVYFDGFVKE